MPATGPTATLLLSIAVVLALAAGTTGCGDGDRQVDEEIPAAAPVDPASPPIASAPVPEGEEDLDTPAAAVSVLVDYYGAITRGDFVHAHALWSDGGPSREELREVHAGDTLDSVEIGEPGRIEPAAGSRWIAIPVEIRSTRADGTGQCLRGSATLRRSEVPGATPEQRRWRLDSADLAPCPAAGAAAEGVGGPDDAEPPDAEEGTDEIGGGVVDGGADDDETPDEAPTEPPAASPAAAEARALVERFGRRLGRVSLLAPADALRERIRSEYGPLVTPGLLEGWLADPTGAPGRQTSSPSPDRIEVGEVLPRPEGGFTVRGEVVLMTSVERTAGGDAGRQAVELTVVPGAGGEWRIARYARR